MNRPLIFIKHVTNHHATHSGYSRLLDFMPGSYIPNKLPMPYYRMRKYISYLVSDKYGVYNSDSIGKEYLLIKVMLKQRNGIAHFLNGERDVLFSTYLKKRQNWSFVASFHKPPDVIENRDKISYKYWEKLDGAVVVAPNQIDFIKEKIKSDAVSFIPHGVDTSFFTPSEKKWEQYTCLFVGAHLRDFDALLACHKIIKQKIPNYRLKVVIPKASIHWLKDFSDIEIISNISDEQLRELYHTSSCLLLPLKDVTACNSILEALACGLPIVTSNVGGNYGYVDETCSYMLEPKDYQGMADAAINLLENESLNLKMRKASRLKGEQFSWENVASSLMNYYDTYFKL